MTTPGSTFDWETLCGWQPKPNPIPTVLGTDIWDFKTTDLSFSTYITSNQNNNKNRSLNILSHLLPGCRLGSIKELAIIVEKHRGIQLGLDCYVLYYLK